MPPAYQAPLNIGTGGNGLKQACFVLAPNVFDEVFSPETVTRIRRQANVAGTIVPGPEWKDHTDILRDAEVIFSSWGSPVIDGAFLDKARKLKVIFYAAGSVRYFVTPEMWKRGIRLSSAYSINAIPVCEYTIGAALLGLKRFWHFSRTTKEGRTFPGDRPILGAYRATIGLVSYGTIARLVRERLRSFDMRVIVYDPFLSAEEAAREGVRKVSLDDLFAESDVVSVHTPLLKETFGMIGRGHLDRMKPTATFINTARGEIVREEELIAFLRERRDVQAILDVTAPEPPLPSSPLYHLPNVELTPHIAGSLGPECFRMGKAMADEFERYLNGRPLQWELDEERVARMA